MKVCLRLQSHCTQYYLEIPSNRESFRCQFSIRNYVNKFEKKNLPHIIDREIGTNASWRLSRRGGGVIELTWAIVRLPLSPLPSSFLSTKPYANYKSIRQPLSTPTTPPKICIEKINLYWENQFVELSLSWRRWRNHDFISPVQSDKASSTNR